MWKVIRMFNESSRKRGFFATAALFLLLVAASFCYASQCSEPPFVSASMVSNVLLILDNSASMYDLAYLCENEEQGKPKCKNSKNGNFLCRPDLCYDDSYDSPYDDYVNTGSGFPGKTYYGNYETEKWYKYNSSGYFEECASGVNPAQKDCLNKQESREDYCIVSLATPEVYFRGNALNWMTTSKLDIEKKVLTGGKYDDFSGDSVLIRGESRGCIGKSFLKQIRCWVPDKNQTYLEGSNFVFSINGPVTEPDTEDDTEPMGSFSSGGLTSIEIYQVDDNFDCQMDDCLNAVTCFSTTDAGPFGQCKQYIKGCLYDFDDGSTDKKSKHSMSAFVHSLLTCRDLARHNGDSAFINEGDIQSIESICKGLYKYQENKMGSIQWGELSDFLNPSLICSRYPYDPSDPAHSNIDAISNGDKIGVGWCYDTEHKDNKGNPDPIWADPFDLDNDSDTSDGDHYDCVKTQLLHFCTLEGTPIIPIHDPLDPSNLLLSETTQEDFYIPAMLIEAGKDALLKGDDDEAALSLENKRLNAEVPQGLLHRVKSKVRLGLLATNPRGSAKEFSSLEKAAFTTYGYQSSQDLDGG